MKKTFFTIIFTLLCLPIFALQAEEGFINNPQSGSVTNPQSGFGNSPQSGYINSPETGTVNCPKGKTCLTNPLKANTIAELFKSVMDAIFIIAIPFFVLAMAGVGLLFVTSRGNPEKLSQAKQWFLYAVIGTGVFFGAWVLVNMLASLMRQLGVPI